MYPRTLPPDCSIPSWNAAGSACPNSSHRSPDETSPNPQCESFQMTKKPERTLAAVVSPTQTQGSPTFFRPIISMPQLARTMYMAEQITNPSPLAAIYSPAWSASTGYIATAYNPQRQRRCSHLGMIPVSRFTLYYLLCYLHQLLVPPALLLITTLPCHHCRRWPLRTTTWDPLTPTSATRACISSAYGRMTTPSG